MENSIKNIIGILSITFMVLIFPNFILASEIESFPPFVTQRVANMSIDEKVGQLFMIGFPYKEVTPALTQFIQEYKVGSFILFKRNIYSIEQIKSLNNDLYRLSYDQTKLPPLIAVDQEGGAVSRLPIFPRPPNFLSLGQTQDPKIAKKYGLEIGRFLTSVGFNMNLAPVLDIVNSQQPSFIGVRSIGSDPKLVALMGNSFSEGLIESRVIPTAKHFPGTGSSTADPHKTISTNPKSRDEIFKTDLVPFTDFLKHEHRSAMMMSHFIYPGLDSANVPASFSKAIMKDLLRDELGYKGIVITDDLQMEGSKGVLETHKASLRSLLAGSDIIMLTWSVSEQKRAIEYVRSYFKKNPQLVAEIDRKVSRILMAKSFVNAQRRKNNNLNFNLMGRLTSPQYQSLENSIFQQNLQQGEFKVHSDRSIASTDTISCFVSNSAAILNSFKKFNTNNEVRLFNLSFSEASLLPKWISKSKCDHIVYVPTNYKFFKIASALPTKMLEKMIYVNTGSPLRITSNNKFLKVIQLSFNYEDLGKRLAENLDIIINSKNDYVLN